MTANGATNTVTVRLGNGDGTVRAPTSFAAGLDPLSLAVGDVNADGKLDLVTANTTGKSVSVLLGNGDGSFQAHGDIPLPGLTPVGYSGVEPLPLPQYPLAVVVGDLNGDGKLDLAVTATSSYSLVPSGAYGNDGYYGNPSASVYKGTVNVLLGNGNGTFQPALMYDTGFSFYPVSVSMGDFNRDGFPDLAVDNAWDNTVSVLLNAKDWSATTQTSSFSISGFPSSTTAGAAGSFTITAKNTDGTTATGYTGTAHFTSSDGQAGLPANYTFTAADNGVHTFSAILKTAGSQTLTATDTTTGSITGNETGIRVTPAAASTMSVTGFPSPITAGVAGSLTVTLKDAYGNLATVYTGTVHFTTSDRKASLPANYTFTAADTGVHTFSAILKTAGAQSITVNDTVTASLTGTDGGITVKPAAASQFIISAPSSVRAGVAFSLTLTVKDAYGNVVIGFTGTIHFKSTDGSASLPANYTFTAADKGVHTFTGLKLRKKGTQKISITDTLNSSLTGSVIENVL